MLAKRRLKMKKAQIETNVPAPLLPEPHATLDDKLTEHWRRLESALIYGRLCTIRGTTISLKAIFGRGSHEKSNINNSESDVVKYVGSIPHDEHSTIRSAELVVPISGYLDASLKRKLQEIYYDDTSSDDAEIIRLLNDIQPCIDLFYSAPRGVMILKFVSENYHPNTT